jgi:hypothetical protein
VARNEAGAQAFLCQYAPRGDRGSENRGLRDLREAELFLGTLKAQLGELVAESVIGLIKRLSGNRVPVGQIFAHANRLRTLPGKQKGDGVRHICG